MADQNDGGRSMKSATSRPKFPCLAAGCTKQFNRLANLERHSIHMHWTDKLLNLRCDYPRCPRHESPFHRPDHFRYHLRNFHKEDLITRGYQIDYWLTESGTVVPDSWWRQRSPTAIYGDWWRCTKCFVRVFPEQDGFTCPNCLCDCEAVRQAVRKLPLQCTYEGCAARPDKGIFMSRSKFRSHLRNEHGEDVPIDERKRGKAELQEADWWASRDAAVVYSPIWRCTRCLAAVDSQKWTPPVGECPHCMFKCEEIRMSFHSGAQGSAEE